MLIKKCIVCGNEFIKPKTCSKIDWFGGKNSRRPLGRRFCSKKCSDINKKGKSCSPKTQFGNRKYIPWLRGTKGIAKPNSGSFKKGHTSWAKGKKLSEARRKQISECSYWKGKTGKRAANWQGGYVEINKKIRNSKKYKEWRDQLFKKYKFKCCICGNKKNLQTHHLKAFALILRKNNIRTIKQANKCDELWDINNGQILCIFCHKQTGSYLINKKGITF